jgi:hypothetical protein
MEYAIRRKPSPAVFAETEWEPEKARAEIREVLERVDDKAHIEFIIKDISTVRRDPKRLWERCQIPMGEVTKIRNGVSM